MLRRVLKNDQLDKIPRNDKFIAKQRCDRVLFKEKKF